MAKYLISFPSAAMVVPDGELEPVGRDAHFEFLGEDPDVARRFSETMLAVHSSESAAVPTHMTPRRRHD